MRPVLLMMCVGVLCSGQQVPRGWWDVEAAQQTSEGHTYHLSGNAQMRGSDIVFRADHIDYDEDKAMVHLAGHVTIETKAVTFSAEDVDYDVKSGEIRESRGEVKVKLKQVP